MGLKARGAAVRAKERIAKEKFRDSLPLCVEDVGGDQGLRLDLRGTAVPAPASVTAVLEAWEERENVVEFAAEASSKSVGSICKLLPQVREVTIVGDPESGRRSALSELRGSDVVSLLRDMDCMRQLRVFRFVGHSTAVSAARALSAVLANNAESLTYLDLSHNNLPPEALKLLSTSIHKSFPRGSLLDSHVTNVLVDGNGTKEARVDFYAALFDRLLQPCGEERSDSISGSEEGIGRQQAESLPATATPFRAAEKAAGAGRQLVVRGFPSHAEKLEAVLSLLPSAVDGAVEDCDVSLSINFLAQILRGPCVLRTLSLKRANLDDRAAAVLAKALGFNTSVNTLLLEGNHIGKAGCAALAKMLRLSKKCRIVHCDLDDEDLRTVLAIRTRVAKHEVDLADLGLSRSQMKVVATMLRANKRMGDLDLSGNPFGSAGLKFVCAAIAANSGQARLTDVAFEKCDIDDVGASMLAKIVEDHPSIVAINLRNNRITNKGAVALRGAVARNRKADLVELDGNPIDAHVLAAIGRVNLQRTPPKKMKRHPILDTDMRIGRQLESSVGGMLLTRFGASLLVQCNDMIGTEALTAHARGGAAGGGGGMEGAVTRLEHGAIPFTIARLTRKGRDQCPIPPGKVRLMGEAADIVPHELGYSMGAIVRLFHGLHARKSARSGFVVLYFPGYEAFSPGAEASGVVARSLGTEDVVAQPPATDEALLSPKARERRRKEHEAARQPKWTIIDPKWYRMMGPYVEVVTQRNGVFATGWDFEKGSCRVNAHVLVFSVSGGISPDEGDVPIDVVIVPDARGPASLQQLVDRVCIEMLGDKGKLCIVGCTKRPIVVRTGHLVSAQLGGNTVLINRPWDGEPQRLPRLFMRQCDAPDGIQRGQVSIYQVTDPISGGTKQGKQLLGNVLLSVRIVSRLPLKPKSFRVLLRTRHSTVLAWDPSDGLRSTSGYTYRLMHAGLGLTGYSSLDRLMKAHVEDRSKGVLKFVKYWEGSGSQLEIDNDFYAGVFELYAVNQHGESLPSDFVLVHPSTQFADDRIALTKAVRLYEMRILQEQLDAALADMKKTPSRNFASVARSTLLLRKVLRRRARDLDASKQSFQCDEPTTHSPRTVLLREKAEQLSMGPAILGTAPIPAAGRMQLLAGEDDGVDLHEEIADDEPNVVGVESIAAPDTAGTDRSLSPENGSCSLASPVSYFVSGETSIRKDKILEIAKSLLRRSYDDGLSEVDTDDSGASSPASSNRFIVGRAESGRSRVHALKRRSDSGASFGSSAKSIVDPQEQAIAEAVAQATREYLEKYMPRRGMRRYLLEDMGAEPLYDSDIDGRSDERGSVSQAAESVEQIASDDDSVAGSVFAASATCADHDLGAVPGSEDARGSSFVAATGGAGGVPADTRGTRQLNSAVGSDTESFSNGTRARLSKSSRTLSKRKGAAGGAGFPKPARSTSARDQSMMMSLAEFEKPTLEPGVMYSRITLGGAQQHLVDIENRLLLQDNLLSRDVGFDPDSFESLFGFGVDRAYDRVARRYSFGKSAPYVALVAMGLERQAARVSDCLVCRDSAAQFLSFCRKNFVRCQRTLVENYAYTLALSKGMLIFLRRIEELLYDLRRPGWLKRIVHSEADTRMFYNLDHEVIKIFESVNAAGVTEWHHNMKAPRKYIPESEAKALTIVFLENVVAQTVGGRVGKGIVPELSRQLDVPVGAAFDEVSALLRSQSEARERSEEAHKSTMDIIMEASAASEGAESPRTEASSISSGSPRRTPRLDDSAAGRTSSRRSSSRRLNVRQTPRKGTPRGASPAGGRRSGQLPGTVSRAAAGSITPVRPTKSTPRVQITKKGSKSRWA